MSPDELQARIAQLEAVGRALVDALDGIYLDGPTADIQEALDARTEFRAVLDGGATPADQCDRCVPGEGGERIDVHTFDQAPCEHITRRRRR